jgi:hypothetical protein
MNLGTPKKTDRLGYVKGLLAMHGIKNRHIALSLGITDAAISRFLAGRMKSRRVQEAVAGSLNMSYEDVWGERPQSQYF